VTLVLGMEAAITSFSANYIYEESNEAHLSVLVAVCVLILLFFVKYRSILIRIAMSGIAIIMLVSMIIMHTRTPAIAVLICAVYLLLISKKSYKGLLLFVIVTIVLLIIGIKTGFLNSLIEELFPAHMSDHRITGMDSLDVFLSGRVTLYEICWRDFLSSPIIGVGNWDYVDSFPLYVLATGGFFSAVLLLPIAYGIPLRGVFKREKIMLSEINDDYYCKLFTFAKVIAVFYTIVSITEASPPLGTGTMVFVPWIVYGMRKRVEDDGSFKNDE
jgi:O-antigen ligase